MFFCLYVQSWTHPVMCNSAHSRLFGFLTTVPALWRTFQCLRRYNDTRNAFPHLANGAKYIFTILHYLSLSLYRIDLSTTMRVLFIFFATVNSTYCCELPGCPPRRRLRLWRLT
jgi:hypothetical protein